MPCGRCRQLLYEHGGPDCLVDAPGGALPVRELLPYAFGPSDLSGAAGPDNQPAPHLRDMLGRGTVFIHPDTVGGQRVWTAYWDGSDRRRPQRDPGRGTEPAVGIRHDRLGAGPDPPGHRG